MKIPITQSREWHQLQQDLGEESVFISEKSYQFLAIVKRTPVGNYLYCPYGPVAKDQASFKQALKSLQALARERRAIFVRIEPWDAEFAKSLPKKSVKSHDLNPKETWLLDLTGNDDDLKAKLPSRLLRYYKSAAKKGITIETSHDPADIHYLLDLQKALADKKGISTFSEDYLKTELQQPFATLYLVKAPEDTLSRSLCGDGPQRERLSPVTTGAKERSEKDVSLAPSLQRQSAIFAAGLVFDDKDTRYNLQGAQTDEGRKLHATGILTIQLILDAKAKGLKTFDFWGIAPEGAPDNHPWKGFTNFKKTFAGYQQDHAGTHDLVLNHPKYKLYQLLRKINRLRRKA